jgi:hypothetical protein
LKIKNVPVNGIIAIDRDACRNKEESRQWVMTIFITCRYAGSCASGSFFEIWKETFYFV